MSEPLPPAPVGFPVLIAPEGQIPTQSPPATLKTAYDSGNGASNPNEVDHARYADVSGALANPPALGTAAFLDVPVSGNATPGQVVLGSDSRLVDVGSEVFQDDPRLSNARVPVPHASTHLASGSDPISGLQTTSDWNTLTNKPSVFPPDATAEKVANKGQVNGYAGLGSDGKVPSGQLPSIVSGSADWNTLTNKPASFTPSAHAGTHAQGGGDAVTVVKAQVSDLGTIGTAAALNVPASGNASTAQVVKGDDTRLTNSRTPTTHASTHASGQADAVTLTKNQISDFPTLGTSSPLDVAASGNASAGQVVKGNDTRLTDARTPSAHSATHKSGGADSIKLDELAAPTDVTTLNVSTAAHGLVPKLNSVSTNFLDGTGAWSTPSGTGGGGTGDMQASVYAAGTGASNTHTTDHATYADAAPYSGITGTPTLGTSAAKDIPASGNASSTQVVYGSDTRLSDSRTPTAHAATHKSGGSDAIKLDELAVTTDVTTLNATSSGHGLLPKLSGTTSTFFRGDGTYSGLPTNSTSSAGVVTTAPNIQPQVYRGDATFGYPGGAGRCTSSFTVPASGSAVTLAIATSSTWPVVGQIVFITDGTIKFLAEITTVTNATSIQVTNRPFPGNPTSGVMATGAAMNLVGVGYATATTAGLLPVPPNNTTTWLRGDATYTAVPYSSLTGTPSTFAPSAHATSHESGGSDAIPLDTLGATTDVTTLNSSTSAHGLLPKLSGTSTQYLSGSGTWATPAGGGDMSKATYDTAARGYVDRAVLSDSATAVAWTGVTGKPSFFTTTTNGTFAVPAAGSTQSIVILAATWPVVGQTLFITDGTLRGFFEVTVVTDSTHLTIRNPGYVGNSVSGTMATSASVSMDGPSVATATAPGFLPTPPNTTTTFLRGDATYTAIPAATATVSGLVPTPPNNTTTYLRGDATFAAVPAATATVSGLVPTPPNNTTTFLRGDATFAAPIDVANSTSVAGDVPASPNDLNQVYRGNSTWGLVPGEWETNAAFTIPAVGSTVPITFVSTTGMAVGLSLAFFDSVNKLVLLELTVLTDATHATFINRGQGVNATGVIATLARAWPASSAICGTSTPGLVPAPPNVSSQFLNGTGVFSTPLTMTASAGGLVPTPPNNTTTYLRGDATFAAVPYASVTGTPTLGTSAAKDIPASGNASATQVVYGSDTRLSDSRTPTAHQATHVGGSDAIPVATSLITGLCPVLDNATIVVTATKLAVGAVPNASVTGLGNAALLTAPSAAVNATSGQLVKGDDTRLTDARTPSAHASTHNVGGSDVLAAATATVSGLVPTPPNNTNKWFRGDASFTYSAQSTETNGTFTVPAAGSTVGIVIQAASWPVVGQTLLITDGTRIGFFEVAVVTDSTHLTVANRGYLSNSTSGVMASGSTVRVVAPGFATATQPGFVPTPPNNTTTYLRGDATFAAVPTATATTSGLLPTPPNTTTTFLRGDATFTTIPAATATVSGLVPAPPNNTTTYLRGDATFAAVPSATATVSGLVPTPPNTTTTFLRGDATFASIPVSTTSASGLNAALPSTQATLKFDRGDGAYALLPNTVYVTTSFIIPAVGSTVPVVMSDTSPFVNSVTVFLSLPGSPGGFFDVFSITDATNITLLNRGYLGTTAPTSVVAANTLVAYVGPGAANATHPGFVPLPPNNTTTYLRGDATFAAVPAATSTVSGLVPTPPNNTTTFLRGDATFAAPATMTSTVGGLVPTPPNNTTTYLRGDGTFATPSGGTGTTYLTQTNGTFTCPAANGTVNVTFTSTADMLPGVGVYINTAGLFSVSSVTSGTVAVMRNTGVTGNATSGVIGTPQNVYLNGATTNATATLAGLVPAPPNSTTQFLRGDATFAAVPAATATVSGLVPTPPNNTTTFLRGDATFAAPATMSATVGGLVPTPPNNTTTFLRGDATFAAPAPDKPFKTWVVGLEGSPPATLYAVFGTQNSRPHLAFNDAATWGTLLFGVVPTGVALGSGFIVRLKWKSITVTTGNAVWGVALERMNTGQGTDSLDTQATATTACSGTVSVLVETAITITTIDSMVAGDGFMLQVQRIGANGSDTMVGDGCLVTVSIETVA